MSTYNNILANFQALGFSNSSVTAIFKKLAEAIGIPIDNTLQEIANSEIRINSAITNMRYGKSGYYQTAALAFQNGDNLTPDLTPDPVTGIISFNQIYAVIDSTKQIVKQAAFSDVDGSLFIKIAKANGSDLQQLTSGEFAAFNSYFDNFEIPGLPVTRINAAANVLSFSATATYSATFNKALLIANLTTALNTFKQSFQFDGGFFTGDLQDYIKVNVPGIRDFYVFDTNVDGLTFSGYSLLTSGYFNYISTILDQITYTAI